MDRARDFDFVKQYPRTSFDEVDYRDELYDRQVLLNETWADYCARKGYEFSSDSEVPCKWVTESWEEYEMRIPQRAAYLNQYAADQQAVADASAQALRERDQQSNRVVAQMAALEAAAESQRTQQFHTLYVDFEQQQLEKMARERLAVEEEDLSARGVLEGVEVSERQSIYDMFNTELAEIQAYLARLQKEKEEAEEREREEQRRKAEALRADEERRRKEAEEAEKKRREAEEEAKRAERRKKDEERKNKAKADREARARQARAKMSGQEDPNAIRAARNEVASKAMGAYLEDLKARVSSAKTVADVQGLVALIPNEIANGRVLFHTCVYGGTVATSEGGVRIDYLWSSDNCSPTLRAGVSIDQNGDRPFITIEECCRRGLPTGVRQVSDEGTIQIIGETSGATKGDFASVPLTLNGTVFGVLSMDTLASNPKDEHNVNPGTYTDYNTPSFRVSLGTAQDQFLRSIAEIISSVSISEEVGDEAPTKQKSRLDVNLSKDAYNSFSELFGDLTGAIYGIDGGLVHAYVSRVKQTGATVVAHNGVSLSDPMRHQASQPTHLLGCSVTDALTTTSSVLKTGALKLADGCAPEEAVEVVENVESDARCISYTRSEKTKEALLLVPLSSSQDPSEPWYVLGISATDAFTPEEVASACSLSQKASGVLAVLSARARLAAMASQASEWMEISTGVKNVYVSLTDAFYGTSSGGSTVVGATASQAWLVGKKIPADVGITKSVMESESRFLHIPDVAENNAVYLFDDAKRGSHGSLMAEALICSGQPVGCIYADTLGSEKRFTGADEQVLRTAASVLSEVLSNELRSSDVRLAVENDVPPSQMVFLRQLWLRVIDDVSRITKEQLSELAGYTSPPPVVPLTVSATMMIAIGSKPSAVKEWNDARKKVKQSIIDRLVAFDPTSGKRKKAFFIRVRKMTAGLTANEVFTRGSYPTSCFFTWTFMALLLRKVGDRLRTKVASGLDDDNHDAVSSVADTEAADDLAEAEGASDADEGEDDVEQ